MNSASECCGEYDGHAGGVNGAAHNGLQQSTLPDWRGL